MTDDRVAAYLAEVRERASGELAIEPMDHPDRTASSARDALRLLAAIDGVLALVAEADAWATRPLDGWALNPARVREAISAALLGEEGSHG
jgi:hypothetical protein